MSTVPPSSDFSLRRCLTCGLDLGPGDLVCGQCHALVHAEELTIIAARANRMEEEGDHAAALQEWRRSLPMLPASTTQAAWVLDHIRKMELAAKVVPPPEKHAWARKLGPLAPIAIFLAKAKWLFALFKLKFLLSLGAFFALYWNLFGWKFGLGVVLSIFFHEMGHYIEIRRRGLPAEMPVFLPGFGAYVRWNAMGISLETRAAVSLAGPLAGLITAFVCLLLFWQTGNSLWAGIARVGAWLNLLNLIPIWILDGAGAANALGRAGRWTVIISSLLLAIALRDALFLLIAGGAVWRLYTRDFPAVPSTRTSISYVALLACLGIVLWCAPGEMFAR